MVSWEKAFGEVQHFIWSTVSVISEWAFYRHWAKVPWNHASLTMDTAWMDTQENPGTGGKRGWSLSNLHLNSILWGCSWKHLWDLRAFQDTDLPHTSPTKSGFTVIQMNLNTDDLNVWAIWGHRTGTPTTPVSWWPSTQWRDLTFSLLLLPSNIFLFRG